LLVEKKNTFGDFFLKSDENLKATKKRRKIQTTNLFYF
jgi:hypothetical protein